VGIVEWNPRSLSTLTLRGASYMDDVVQGDTLVTSGLSAIFPEGLLVGTVAAVRPGPSGLLLDVIVDPAVDFTRLEEVYVLVDSLRLGAPDLATVRTDTAADAAPPAGLERSSTAAGGDAVVELQ
jgi:rod shape-determining protein MreC